jgi:sulfur-carrier protein adenylyltransferase/sulfurtransferase
MLEFLPEELQRYHQHFKLKDFGIEGQKRLKSARVLVIGAGGLGGPVLQYLTAAGVGWLGVADSSRVELNKLQRQILYNEQDIGRFKAEVAVQKLQNNNSHVKLKAYTFELQTSNIFKLLKGYDLVVDCSSTFAHHYLINDACFIQKIPVVYAAISRFQGQLSVFNCQKEQQEAINYRDVFPDVPEENTAPSCAESGLIGAVAGIVGSMQANEAIKLICGLNTSLCGKMMLFDGLSMSNKIFKLKAAPDNPLRNGSHQLPCSNYKLAYGDHRFSKIAKVISPDMLHDWLNSENPPLLLDVRDKQEHKLANMGGLCLPLNQIEEEYHQTLGKYRVVVYCRSGKISAQAIRMLEEKHGIENLYQLKGGILAWAEKFDPEMLLKLHQSPPS